MVKVITYGSYDLLHYGHIRLLERAKALGDYLIVGITSDDYDKTRGKINLKQSLIERIEAVRSTGLADEIIVEEYEGQKIDDIKRLDVDIFTVGSDWEGYFDYLNEYCKVIYLPRTEGISSSEIRSKERKLKLGLVGGTNILKKYYNECKFVNGIEVSGIMSNEAYAKELSLSDQVPVYDDFDELLDNVDALYIVENPALDKDLVKRALLKGVHVLRESPIANSISKYDELQVIAKDKKLILMDAIKTAYATAYNRMLVMAKSGKIGDIVSVDATCTSMHDYEYMDIAEFLNGWNSISAWGPTALLPVFQLFGTDISKCSIISKFAPDSRGFDLFSKVELLFDKAVASVKVGKGVKSEGELVISGTKGYIYVPAPWWKTDYFEVRYESSENNKRYFYQLDGEGIRYELVAFAKAIESGKTSEYITEDISRAIVSVIDQFSNGDVIRI